MTQMKTQEEQREEEDGALLVSMMGDDIDPQVALRVLRKYNGSLQRAADAILAGDRGGEESWQPSTPVPHIAQAPSTVIDLTAEDHTASASMGPMDRLVPNRAPEAEYPNQSIRTTTPTGGVGEVKFGPSDRAPDPNWQVVPSNVQTDAGNDDQTLKRAIEASLKDFIADDADPFPFEETVREGGRPIAIRPEQATLAYAALVIQSLFFVPQVRRAVASLRLPDIEPTLPREATGGTDRVVWNLIELFTNMDLAQLSAIIDKEVTPVVATQGWDGPQQSLSEISGELLGQIGFIIEARINAQQHPDERPTRLFHFYHGRAEIREGMNPKIRRTPGEGCVVGVDVGNGNPAPNDLVSRLAANLTQHGEGYSAHDVIFEPSELVAFHLKSIRSQSTFSDLSSKNSINPFSYPKVLYLDQFLVQNLAIANQKRAQERALLAEIQSLTSRRQALTHYNDRDTLKDLRTSLHYFEHVAGPKTDPARREAIERSAEKLKKILDTLKSRIEGIDHRIEELRGLSANVFNCPELQNHRYDLRAVLFHTGVPGRKQIYSYVQDMNGIWWKTLDFTVTEVAEELVLTDMTGLHLGAGPYLLVYSRHLSTEEMQEPIAWPEIFAESVQGHNATFLSMLPPELAAKAQPMGASLGPATSNQSPRDYLDGRSSPLPRDVPMLNISQPDK